MPFILYLTHLDTDSLSFEILTSFGSQGDPVPSCFSSYVSNSCFLFLFLALSFNCWFPLSFFLDPLLIKGSQGPCHSLV